MFYRRKLILALLDSYEDGLERERFYHLLFLLTRKQGNPSYDFVPHSSGCFSYSVAADLSVMLRSSLVEENNGVLIFKGDNNYIKELKPGDRKLLDELKLEFFSVELNELKRYIFKKYPFYSIHLETPEKFLSEEELTKIKSHKIQAKEITLYTIGYEGISLEEYLVRLIVNDIKILIDVRNNPQSMKFGFSKNQLRESLLEMQIGYLHFPEVGIPGELRNVVESVDDMNRLFTIYKNEILPENIQTQLEILNLLKNHRRIALTCFEADVNSCHRKYLAESLLGLSTFPFKLTHLMNRSASLF